MPHNVAYYLYANILYHNPRLPRLYDGHYWFWDYVVEAKSYQLGSHCLWGAPSTIDTQIIAFLERYLL